MEGFANVNFKSLLEDSKNPLLAIQKLLEAFQKDCMKQTLATGYINGSEKQVLDGIFGYVESTIDKIAKEQNLKPKIVEDLKKELQTSKDKGFQFMFQSLQQWSRYAYHKIAEEYSGPRKLLIKKEGDRFHDAIGYRFNELIIKAQEMAKKNNLDD